MMDKKYTDNENGDLKPQVVVLDVSYLFMKNINYLVVDPHSRQAVVVDPAWEIEKLDHAVAQTQASLRGVLITHSHPDHINLAKEVADKYDCPIWMSREEIAFSGFSSRRLNGIDETPWTVGGMSIQPILTPGHTPGCICYRIADNLFTGDVLFAEGCGMCPDIEGAYAMFASLQRLKNGLKPYTRIFPGHSYGLPAGQIFSRLLKENIYLQFDDRESFAAFRLRRGQDRAKMFKFT